MAVLLLFEYVLTCWKPNKRDGCFKSNFCFPNQITALSVWCLNITFKIHFSEYFPVNFPFNISIAWISIFHSFIALHIVKLFLKCPIVLLKIVIIRGQALKYHRHLLYVLVFFLFSSSWSLWQHTEPYIGKLWNLAHRQKRVWTVTFVYCRETGIVRFFGTCQEQWYQLHHSWPNLLFWAFLKNLRFWIPSRSFAQISQKSDSGRLNLMLSLYNILSYWHLTVTPHWPQHVYLVTAPPIGQVIVLMFFNRLA